MNVTITMSQISALQALPIASPQATVACLEMARQLATPQAVIHIGAGLGHGPLSHWLNWPVAHARVIDSDAKRLEWLPARAAQQANSTDWLALAGVIAEQDGEQELHHASNAAEDGLLPASALVGLWPNLRPMSSSHQQAQRLDTLLSSHPIPVRKGEGTTWLIIECLPALCVLRGATQTLENVSVICLRSVLDPARLQAPEASLDAAVDFLKALGFRCVHIGETNHPAIGEALFLRDETAPLKAECTTLQMAKTAVEQLANQLQSQIDTLSQEKADLTKERAALAQERAELTQARDEQEKLATERQAQIEALQKAKTAAEQLASQHQGQVDTLTKDKAELTKVRDALAQERAELSLARDEQAKLATERQAQIEALQKAKAATEQLASQHQGQIDTLTKDKADLTTERDALAQARAELTQTRDEQAKLATERQAQVEALQKAKAAAEQLATERQGQIDKLAKDKADLTKERDQALQKAKEIQQRLDDSQKQLTHLQDETLETQRRQQCLQEELVKAEAQIELIKDLLLREPGL